MKSFFKVIVILLFTVINNTNGQSGLIAHYKLDGDGRDSGPYGLDGSINGTINSVPDEFGKSCGAMLFGSGAYIEVPHNVAFNRLTNQVTILGKAKLPSQTSSYWISVVCKGQEQKEGPSSPHFRMQFTRLTSSISTTGIQSIKMPYREDEWIKWAITFDNGDFKTYRNGNLEDSKTLSISSLTSNSDPLFIGLDYPGNVESFVGALDDIMIFNRVLDESEINMLQNIDNANCPQSGSTNAVSNCEPSDFLKNTIRGANQLKQEEISVRSGVAHCVYVECTKGCKSNSSDFEFAINDETNLSVFSADNNRRCVSEVGFKNGCNFMVIKSKALGNLNVEIDGQKVLLKFNAPNEVVSLKINGQ